MTTLAQPTTGVGVSKLTWGFAVANLIGQIVIVLTGGVVRLTGSGLGCSDWPYCEPGHFTPVAHEAATYHPYVEFGNRTLTGVLTVISVGLALTALRERDRSRAFRMLAWVPLAGVAVQAVIGGVVVHTGLAPLIVSLHMITSMALVWVSTLMVVRCAEGDGRGEAIVPPRTRTLAWGVAVVLVPLLLLGAITTGAGPHSGDDEVGYRLAVDPAFMARLHAGVVWLFVIAVGLLIAALVRAKAPARARNAAILLAIVTLLQGAIGYTQYFTGLPIALVAIHLLGAALLTAATTWMVLSQRTRGPARQLTS